VIANTQQSTNDSAYVQTGNDELVKQSYTQLNAIFRTEEGANSDKKVNRRIMNLQERH